MEHRGDLFDDPDLQAYLAHAEKEMLPKMKDSALTIAIFDKVNIKLCLEIGAAILFDKPIIVVVSPNSNPIPANLKRVASAIVEGDMGLNSTKAKLQVAISRVIAEDRRVQ